MKPGVSKTGGGGRGKPSGTKQESKITAATRNSNALERASNVAFREGLPRNYSGKVYTTGTGGRVVPTSGAIRAASTNGWTLPTFRQTGRTGTIERAGAIGYNGLTGKWVAQKGTGPFRSFPNYKAAANAAFRAMRRVEGAINRVR